MPVDGCIIGAAKCAYLVLHVSYVDGTSLRGMKDMGRVSASCNVIAMSVNTGATRVILGRAPGVYF